MSVSKRSDFDTKDSSGRPKLARISVNNAKELTFVQKAQMRRELEATIADAQANIQILTSTVLSDDGTFESFACKECLAELTKTTAYTECGVPLCEEWFRCLCKNCYNSEKHVGTPLYSRDESIFYFVKLDRYGHKEMLRLDFDQIPTVREFSDAFAARGKLCDDQSFTIHPYPRSNNAYMSRIGSTGFQGYISVFMK